MCRLMLVILLMHFVGCRAPYIAAKPVVLPSVGQIKSIEVTPTSGESRDVVVIDNIRQIELFVEFVNSRKKGWKKPVWTTFPGGQYTVAAKDENQETVAVFWPSRGHIGGRGEGEDADSNRLRPLTPEDWKELSAILGISD